MYLRTFWINKLREYFFTFFQIAHAQPPFYYLIIETVTHRERDKDKKVALDEMHPAFKINLFYMYFEGICYISNFMYSCVHARTTQESSFVSSLTTLSKRIPPFNAHQQQYILDQKHQQYDFSQHTCSTSSAQWQTPQWIV